MVADEIRRSLSGLLNVSAVGRTLTVTSMGAGGQNNVSRQLQIYLTSRNGRTNVRALEDMKQTAIGLFVGGTVGGGVAAGMGVMGSILSATRSGPLAVGALAATLGLAFSVARVFYVRSVRKREKEMRSVLQRVVARAQESLKAPAEAPRFPRR